MQKQKFMTLVLKISIPKLSYQKDDFEDLKTIKDLYKSVEIT